MASDKVPASCGTWRGDLSVRAGGVLVMTGAPRHTGSLLFRYQYRQPLRRGQAITSPDQCLDFVPVRATIRPDPDPAFVPDIRRHKKSFRRRVDQYRLRPAWGFAPYCHRIVGHREDFVSDPERGRISQVCFSIASGSFRQIRRNRATSRVIGGPWLVRRRPSTELSMPASLAMRSCWDRRSAPCPDPHVSQ